MGALSSCKTKDLLLSAVVIELPDPRRVFLERLWSGKSYGIVLAPQSPDASEGRDACGECANIVVNALHESCKGSHEPDAADSPAPATAMMRLEDFKVDTKEDMS